MKKKALLVTVCALALLSGLWALASGGDASDPLISLSHLTGAFTSTVNTQVDARLDASDEELLSSVEGSTGTAQAAASWQEVRLKEGDVLQAVTGTNVLVLAGGVRADFSAGAVIDVTTGTAISSGTALTVNHRYMTAEDTTASFTVTSKTAVVDYQGYYSFRYSDAMDYNALAQALKTMHLFKGSFTGYGQGFDLEMAPTRIQALIMFIRVLGEEEAALAYTGTTPFADIAKGSQSEKYVGYALSRGYTNGYTPTVFKPNQAVTANQYTEFMLRALGYSSAANTDLTGTMANAVRNGVLYESEVTRLQSNTFLRADLVYVSYFALDALMADTGRTLRDTLMDKGVFTSAETDQAAAMAPDRLF